MNHILGCKYRDKDRSIPVRYKNLYFQPYRELESSRPQTDNIVTYFLINPENLDETIHLDETILGSMDADVKVLGAHFIVESDEVLKCIDPFAGEDIWWISRDDVGDDAKILWVDERGVLVYSFTHQKLYCFE